MINEKIQNLLKELQEECKKEGVSGICTLNKKSNVITMLTGNLTDVAFCLAAQERDFDKDLPIPTKILREAGLKAIEITETVSEKEDIGEFSNIFDQIFGGKNK
ncbi:hypothetical protein [Candidatus Enterococcus leclercqii]|uniref:hypothetical protein n=1 Tax=Candidatus Enterococcus leclercqii TaxID=1857218 RepID=UPI00137A7316|nr:hypothetical protein [Enterococcus sp. CU9D]KAF1291081.1 hypothetical protein BAU14_10855 [Enterococcus sp. CU9D]